MRDKGARRTFFSIGRWRTDLRTIQLRVRCLIAQRVLAFAPEHYLRMTAKKCVIAYVPFEFGPKLEIGLIHHSIKTRRYSRVVTRGAAGETIL